MKDVKTQGKDATSLGVTLKKQTQVLAKSLGYSKNAIRKTKILKQNGNKTEDEYFQKNSSFRSFNPRSELVLNKKPDLNRYFLRKQR